MDLELYIWLVALAALIYAAVSRTIQGKFVNKKEMEEIQKESKALNQEYKKAAERNDKAAMEKIMKKQMELFPRMNKMMFASFKPMIIILLFFGGFIYVVNHFDPTTQDDITLMLSDDGKGCDESAGDNIYSGCYEIGGENQGKWTFSAVALSSGAEIGNNQTYFFYGREDSDRYAEGGKGAAVAPSTDKQMYYEGDTVRLYASAPSQTTEVKAVLNNGTWFYVDLPFTLPIFNVKRIYHPYWWFILISVVLGLIISFILKRVIK